MLAPTPELAGGQVAITPADAHFARRPTDPGNGRYRYNAGESPIRAGSYPVSVAVGPRERLIVDYEIRKDGQRISGYFVAFP
jgi:hypothetical protein